MISLLRRTSVSSEGRIIFFSLKVCFDIVYNKTLQKQRLPHNISFLSGRHLLQILTNEPLASQALTKMHYAEIWKLFSTICKLQKIQKSSMSKRKLTVQQGVLVDSLRFISPCRV